jgi:hypothetical protein
LALWLSLCRSLLGFFLDFSHIEKEIASKKHVD